MTFCAEEFQKRAANYDSIAGRLWLFKSQLITLSGTRDQEESGDLEALYSARAPGLGGKRSYFHPWFCALLTPAKFGNLEFGKLECLNI